jgi:FkbM family methyltransferase
MNINKMTGKNWKLFSDKNNHYWNQNLDFVLSSNSFFGYEFLFKEIYGWEFSETNCIYEMWDCKLNPEDVVVDLGANVGFFTHLAAKKCKEIIAIDGGYEVFSCLIENTKEHNNVKYLNASVLGKSLHPTHLWSPKHNPLYLQMEDVFKIFNLEKIDFLKCDIEGGEYDLFQNLDESILNKINKIAVETHDPILNETFFIPGKVRHSFYWDVNNNGEHQTMFYFVNQ